MLFVNLFEFLKSFCMKSGYLHENAATLELILKVIDVLIIFFAGEISFYLKFGSYVNIGSYILFILLAMVLCYFIFSLCHVYKPWRGSSIFLECYTMLYSYILSALVLMSLTYAFKVGIHFPREWMFVWFAITLILFLIFRIVARTILSVLRKAGYNQRSICLIGSSGCGEKVFEHLLKMKSAGFTISAVFSNILTPEFYGNYFKGTVDGSEKWFEYNNVDQVWIAVPLNEISTVEKVMHFTRFNPVTIRFVPDIFAFKLLNHSFTEISGMPVINLHTSPMGGINSSVKRFEDIVLSILFIILSSPFLVMISCIIKLTSSGSVFYRQKRVSIYNYSFDMLKFRSMPSDIESETGAVWAKKGENRATPFGRFLRKTSLDELPQFFNVLKGEMSIVGPRPERPEFVEKFKDEIPFYMKKHMVKAGMTGWAQINGWRGDTDLGKRIEYDLYYIENWSFLFDMKIIIQTFTKGIFNKNAY